MVLPQELLDAIVEEVDDRDSLQTCSLVAKSLVIASQRCLFRSLYLYTKSNHARHPSPTCERAYALLSSSPHLAKYVRTLTVCLAQESAEDYVPAQRLIQMLNLLSRFAVHGSSDRFRWDLLSSGLVCSIVDAIQRPSIQCFHLKRIRGVPSSLMFYAASAFRVFSVERVEILQDTGPSALLPQGSVLPTRLEELLIPAAFRSEATCKFLLDVHAQGALQHLRRVAWRIYGNPNPQWDLLLREASRLNTLERVELWFTLQFPEIELPSFPHMRTLELKCRMETPSIPSSIQSIIARLPSTTPRLECLILSLRVSSRSYPAQEWPTNIDALPPFDNQHYIQKMPALHQVYCCLKESSSELHDGFAPYMKHKFPGPQIAGILLCETIQPTGDMHQ
ncbi:hypothetical protein FB451DRAFT_1261631 [Mycena latifolia]|nr:hypothetical protein FB451DRAFT_1261631 [Mycena latifolia]